MRLRKVEYAEELINNKTEYIINKQDKEPLSLGKQPIHLEIGMGKGAFIHKLSNMNKDIYYVGIEKFDSVIVRALEKQIEDPQENLMLVRGDAIYLEEYFKEDKVERIYLNFSDPWPKERHAKRRLTHRNFLKRYENILVEDGEIHFKTDNIDLFMFSLEEINEYGMEILFQSFDLHNENVDNIMTEFEERYSKKGNKINKVVCKFRRKI